MSAAERLPDQVATFPTGKGKEARYLSELEALLCERNAVGEMTLTLWGNRQKPPVLGTEAERLMNLLVKQGVATCSRRDINAPLVWRLSAKAKRTKAQTPSTSAQGELPPEKVDPSAQNESPLPSREQASPPPAKALVPPKAPKTSLRRSAEEPRTSAKPKALFRRRTLVVPPQEQNTPAKPLPTEPIPTTPEEPTPESPAVHSPEPEEATAPTVPASPLPESQRPPSSFPPPLSEEPVLIAGDAVSTGPIAHPAPLPSAPHAQAGLPALAPSPADLLRSLPPTGPILPPRLDVSPTAPSPTPPPGEETPLHQLTSEVVLKLGLSLRDRERLGQQLIAIGQLLRGDLKPNLGLQGLSESTARVYQAMSTTPELPSTIARRLGVDNQQVSNSIKTLSLRGLVVRAAYGLWRLA